MDGCYSWWQGALFGGMEETKTISTTATATKAEGGVSLSSSFSSSSLSSFPAFDASKLPALPGLPPLPAGMSKAPTATERMEREVEEKGDSSSLPSLAAALEEARAASRVREQLPPLPSSSDPSESSKSLLFDPLGLQMWILAYCQAPSSSSSADDDEEEDGENNDDEGRRPSRRQRKKKFRGGGLRDKPGKPPDHYHTCYCLSGLSAAQEAAVEALGADSGIVGGEGNRLEKTHPLLNVAVGKVLDAAAFFEKENGRM